MKNLVLILLIALCIFSCKEDLTEAETIANLVEQRWIPSSDCECASFCFYEYTEITSSSICYKHPDFPLDESIDCISIRQSSENPKEYLYENNTEFTVLEVTESEITMQYITSSTPCIFKGIR